MLAPRRLLTALCLAALAPLAAQAQERLSSRAAFVAAVEGKALTRVGVRLRVGGDGSIAGRAFGRDVSGSWRWSEGFFCREIRYTGGSFPDDCQVVTLRGNRITFTAERGGGDSAGFTLAAR